MLGILRKGVLQALRGIHDGDNPVSEPFSLGGITEQHRSTPPSPNAPATGEAHGMEQLDHPRITPNTGEDEYLEPASDGLFGQMEQLEHPEQLVRKVFACRDSRGRVVPLPGPVEWDPQTHCRIAWLMTLVPADLPNAGFQLDLHRKVSDPERFLARLSEEAARGPLSPRARAGAFQQDLAKLESVIAREVQPWPCTR